MKFSLLKEAREELQLLRSDEGFYQRQLMRIRIGKTAILMSELQRVGQQGKQIKDIDYDSGQVEVQAIETAKDLPKNGAVK